MKLPRLSVIALGVVALAMISFMIVKVISTPLPQRASPAGPTPDETGGSPAVVITPTFANVDVFSGPLTVTRPYTDAPSMNALELINTLRIAEGVWPLRPNPTLNSVAQGQAGYLATLPGLPPGEAVHQGAEGHNAPQRAHELGWPDFGAVDKTEIGEVVAATPSGATLFDAWMRSPADRATLASDRFREIGLASVSLPDRVIAVAVLGARPGVLPALVDHTHRLLYLSTERSPYASPSGGAWIGAATRAQVTYQDLSGVVQAEAWQPWALALSAPPTSAPFNVSYSDDAAQATTTVDPAVDIVWLPGLEALGGTNPTAPAESSAGATPESALASPTPPVSTATPAGGLTLVYDQHSLAVINTSGGLIDLRRLVLTGQNLSLPGKLWDTPWLDKRIYLFPAEDCVQVWAWNEGNPGPPAECRFMRSAIYVAPTERFWQVGSFDALWNGHKAAACMASAGRCVVKMP